MSLTNRLRPGTYSFEVLVFIVISSLVVVLVAIASLWDYYDPEKVFSDFAVSEEREPVAVDDTKETDESLNDKPEYQLPLRVNIVFLGLDQTEQVERFGRQEIADTVQTDAIIFASLDIRNQTVKAINISRDAKVPIINAGFNDKINHAYSHGKRSAEDDSISGSEEGVRYSLETIENLLGVPVDFYVTIDIDDLIEIVDLMGGIYYDVEKDIRADLGQGRVLIEEGYQHLDGKHYFYYVQYRDVYGRHHDRMDRHQRILKSTFEQFRKTGNLTRIPSVLNKLSGSIKTNLESRHIGALARFAGDLDMDDVNFYSFEGEGIFTELGYYFYIDEEHRAEMLEEVLDAEVEELGIAKGVPVEEEEEDSGLNLFQGDNWDD